MSIFDRIQTISKHQGVVERIAFSTRVHGGMGMGCHSTTTCHLLLKDAGTGIVSDIIAFDTEEASAIHLTQLGDHVALELTDEDGLVHFDNQTTGLKAMGS